MDSNTAFFIIFNLLYNADNIFCNFINDAKLKLKIWSIESIKENKIFEEIIENKEKNDILSYKDDLYNMSDCNNSKRNKVIIKLFFKVLLKNFKNMKDTNLFIGIIKILKKKEILRWLIFFNLDIFFLKKIYMLFIYSENPESYFILYIIIQNIFFLYNEKKKKTFQNISENKDASDDVKNTFLVEKTIFAMYQRLLLLYIKHYGANYNNANLKHFYFKENCLTELFSYLSHDVAYIIVFKYMQIIIQRIKEEFKIVFENKNKDTENIKKKKNDNIILSVSRFHLHSSYIILLLRFLTKIINMCENLDILTYGLTTLIIAILKMKLTIMKYLPVNLQLINMMIRLMEDKKKYIPLFSYFTCILNGLKYYQHVRVVSKDSLIRKSIEDFDINTTIELDVNIIPEYAVSYQIYTKIHVMLYDYIGLMAQHVSFPEFFIAIKSYLKKYIEDCKINFFAYNLKKLLMYSKKSIEIIIKSRKNFNIFNINDKINHIENNDLPLVKERLNVMKQYEDTYLMKLEAKLSGLKNIKNNKEKDKENLKYLKKMKKNKKKNYNDDNDKKNKIKKIKTNPVQKKKKQKKLQNLPECDLVENFSLSSEEESS